MSTALLICVCDFTLPVVACVWRFRGRYKVSYFTIGLGVVGLVISFGCVSFHESGAR